MELQTRTMETWIYARIKLGVSGINIVTFLTKTTLIPQRLGYYMKNEKDTFVANIYVIYVFRKKIRQIDSNHRWFCTQLDGKYKTYIACRRNYKVPYLTLKSGGRLNIKKPSYQYRDSHVKDKTVSPTVLSLTWESPYLGKTVFILRRGPGIGYLRYGYLLYTFYSIKQWANALCAGPRLNIKTVLSTYGDFHVKDKTAVRTSYL